MLFKDEYDFLSNMHECNVQIIINDIPYMFLCAESAFQALKDPSRVNEFINLNGYQAKKLGQQVQLRPDWEEKKINLMFCVLTCKFEQNQFLRVRLSQIKGDIIEDNTWNDRFWGVWKGVGENHLGKLLTNLRDKFNPFYCLVVGSRGFNDYNLMCQILDYMLQNKTYIVIVSGGAKGADSLAERYAKERGLELKVFPADWDKYGKSAGYRRNEQMHLWISARHNRGVVAFWDSISKGTAHNFELCKTYGNPIRCYNYIENKYITIE